MASFMHLSRARVVFSKFSRALFEQDSHFRFSLNLTQTMTHINRVVQNSGRLTPTENAIKLVILLSFSVVTLFPGLRLSRSNGHASLIVRVWLPGWLCDFL